MGKIKLDWERKLNYMRRITSVIETCDSLEQLIVSENLVELLEKNYNINNEDVEYLVHLINYYKECLIRRG